MTIRRTRRQFIKTAAVGIAGAAATGTTPSVMAQQSVKINPNAKAVMPDGTLLTREQILTKLGLDARTTADRWLNVTKCDSNAAALSPAQIKDLVDKGVIKKQDLDVHSLPIRLIANHAVG